MTTSGVNEGDVVLCCVVMIMEEIPRERYLRSPT